MYHQCQDLTIKKLLALLPGDLANRVKIKFHIDREGFHCKIGKIMEQSSGKLRNIIILGDIFYFKTCISLEQQNKLYFLEGVVKKNFMLLTLDKAIYLAIQRQWCIKHGNLLHNLDHVILISCTLRHISEYKFILMSSDIFIILDFYDPRQCLGNG